MYEHLFLGYVDFRVELQRCLDARVIKNESIRLSTVAGVYKVYCLYEHVSTRKPNMVESFGYRVDAERIISVRACLQVAPIYRIPLLSSNQVSWPSLSAWCLLCVPSWQF